jgi:acyl-coenzyme A thioesterase PaaI-like protein
MDDEILLFDAPDNVCFGCSPHNEQGLQLRFVRSGPRSAECRFSAAPHLAGQATVVHGGIQATLLDETMGIAAHMAFPRGDDVPLATAEMKLQYRQPVPIGEPITVRAELRRADGPDLYVDGAILSEAGQVLTTAEARWRRLDKARR